MRPEVAATLLLWFAGLIVALAVVVVVLLVERAADRRLRDNLIDGAGRDGKTIVARNEEITALKAENDGLRVQLRSFQPRRSVVSQWRPADAAEAELWRRFEADVCPPAPPGFPERERLDGGEVA